MSQQPLAFTLVKTVVTAQDEGRALDPAIHTAWDLLREELGARVVAVERQVSWGPDHQEQLRQMIDALRDYFEKDPALEGEISTLLDERKRINALAAVAYPEAPEADGAETQVDEEEPDAVEPDAVEPDAVEPDAVEPAAMPEVEPDLPAVDDRGDEVPEDTARAPGPTELPADLAALAAIPMIILDEDMTAELEADERTAGAAPEVPAHDHDHDQDHDEALPIVMPTLTHRDPAAMFVPRDGTEPMPTVEKLPYTAIPAEVVPPRRGTSLAWLYWLLAAIAVALFAVALYFMLREPQTDLVTDVPPVEADVPETLAVPTAPRVADLRESGDVSGARRAQADYVSALGASNAPPALRAEALAELAQLAILADAPLDAVTTQLQSLELTKEVAGDDSPAAGASHLVLADYYLANGERQMADAHFKQGRRLLTMGGATPTPEQQAQLDKLLTQLSAQ